MNTVVNSVVNPESLVTNGGFSTEFSIRRCHKFCSIDWEDVGGDIIKSTANVFTGGIAGSAVDAVLGNDPAGEAEDAVEHGASVDMRQFKQQHKFKYKFGRRKGLTPVELLGEGGGMSGGPGTAATSVLGNQAGAAEMQNRQLQMQLGTELAKTKMQTDTQRDIADKQVGAQTRGQDLTFEAQMFKNRLDEGKLYLDNKTFEEVTVPAAAAQLQIANEELQKVINEVANTQPEWVRHKTLLQLGVDNTIQNAILARHKVDITDRRQIAELGEPQYKALMAELLAAKATTTTELRGIKVWLQELIDDWTQLSIDDIFPKKYPDIFERLQEVDLGNFGSHNKNDRDGYRGRYNLQNTIGVEG